ncbi:putative reverse transcriptase domain-containing protein [Tanacetum coccineum]
MELVFHISNCTVENQVKFATCTFLGNALSLWNSHMKSVTQDVAYAMDWKTLKKMMTVKYCPRGEIKKLEIKLWNLKVKVEPKSKRYWRFHKLALMCGRMFPEESNKVERYVGGLPDMIRGNGYQQQNKRQNTRRAYTARPGEKREYTRSFPVCTKCNYHNKGPCAPRCNKCKKIGHLARDCRSSGPNGNNKNRGNSGMTQNAGTCYKCGVQGNFKRDCPKFKNNKCGNQGRNGNALAKVYVVGNAGTNPDSNVVTGAFLLNNRYASILFYNSIDRSFVSTAFSSLIDITPTTLDHYYDVELVDGKIIGINIIIRGCRLNFLNHPFDIDLMPVEIGSFDVIIGMDWLAKYHAVIVCAEKIVRIPWGNETLIVHGDGRNRGNNTRLNIISCTKTQKYMLKGCHVFLAHVSTKETEDKSGEKQLEDIDLIPGAAPVAQAPYRLAPSEMKELSKQLQELSDRCFIRPSSSPCVPILALPQGAENFIVYCDASHKGLGVVLMQNEKTKAQKPKNLKNEDVGGMIRKDILKEKLEPHADSALFLPIRETDPMEKLARMYLKEALGISLDMSIAYHPETDGQSERTIQTLEDMLCACVIDFGNGWAEVGEVQLTGPEIVQETTEKIIQIKQRIQAARDRQKSYADLKRKPMEFQVGDRLMLKVLAKVGAVAYKLELPQELSRVHSIFHVSNLKKCYSDEPLAIPLDGLHIDEKLHFVEEPVEIMDREVKRLKQRRISIVQVWWNSRRGLEFTWEREDQFQKKYPHLFIKPVPSSSVAT